MNQKPSPPKHGCAVCSAPIAAGKLMCLPHWRSVPAPLAMSVTRSWRNYIDCRKPELRADRLKSYYAARQAAIDAVMSVAAATPALPTPTVTTGALS